MKFNDVLKKNEINKSIVWFNESSFDKMNIKNTKLWWRAYDYSFDVEVGMDNRIIEYRRKRLIYGSGYSGHFFLQKGLRKKKNFNENSGFIDVNINFKNFVVDVLNNESLKSLKNLVLDNIDKGVFWYSLKKFNKLPKRHGDYRRLFTKFFFKSNVKNFITDVVRDKPRLRTFFKTFKGKAVWQLRSKLTGKFFRYKTKKIFKNRRLWSSYSNIHFLRNQVSYPHYHLNSGSVRWRVKRVKRHNYVHRPWFPLEPKLPPQRAKFAKFVNYIYGRYAAKYPLKNLSLLTRKLKKKPNRKRWRFSKALNWRPWKVWWRKRGSRKLTLYLGLIFQNLNKRRFLVTKTSRKFLWEFFVNYKYLVSINSFEISFQVLKADRFNLIQFLLNSSFQQELLALLNIFWNRRTGDFKLLDVVLCSFYGLMLNWSFKNILTMLNLRLRFYNDNMLKLYLLKNFDNITRLQNLKSPVGYNFYNRLNYIKFQKIRKLIREYMLNFFLKRKISLGFDIDLKPTFSSLKSTLFILVLNWLKDLSVVFKPLEISRFKLYKKYLYLLWQKVTKIKFYLQFISVGIAMYKNILNYLLSVEKILKNNFSRLKNYWSYFQTFNYYPSLDLIPESDRWVALHDWEVILRHWWWGNFQRCNFKGRLYLFVNSDMFRFKRSKFNLRNFRRRIHTRFRPRRRSDHRKREFFACSKERATINLKNKFFDLFLKIKDLSFAFFSSNILVGDFPEDVKKNLIYSFFPAEKNFNRKIFNKLSRFFCIKKNTRKSLGDEIFLNNKFWFIKYFSAVSRISHRLILLKERLAFRFGELENVSNFIFNNDKQQFFNFNSFFLFGLWVVFNNQTLIKNISISFKTYSKGNSFISCFYEGKNSLISGVGGLAIIRNRKF